MRREPILAVGGDAVERNAFLAELAEYGYWALGIGGPTELDDLPAHMGEDPPTPTLVLLSARGGRAQFERDIALLKERLAGVPIIVIGRVGTDVDAELAFALGAVDYVNRGSDPMELKARIHARLTGRRHVVRLTRQQRGSEMVLELTQALSSKLHIRDILRLVVRRIAEVVAVDRVSIVLGGGGEDTAYVIAASDDEGLRDLPIQLRDYPEIAEALTSGTPIVIEDATNHPLFDIAEVAGPKRFRALTLLPILFEDRPMGVLFLRNEMPRAVSDQDMFLLSAVANATGIALRNARLLKTLREQSRRSRFAHFEAEQRLKVLERYLDFFNSSADGIVVVTHEGQVLFCNPAACQITGRQEHELTASNFEAMLTEDAHGHFASLRGDFSKGVFPKDVDLPIRTPAGERRVLSVNFNTMWSQESGVIISLRDVTRDRATARELTRTKEFLQRVIDSSVDVIVSADMGGTVLLFNPAAERTYGYSASEVVGRVNVRDLYPVGKAREIMRRMRDGDDGEAGTIYGYETELLARDGKHVPVMLSASLIVHRGRPIGSVGVFRDLRARRRIEKRLADTQRALEVTGKQALIAELAGAAAHELNQPLTAVMGYAFILQQQLDEDSRLGRASGAIVKETERMAEIVRKIGKLTKYETKAYVGDTKIIDLDRSIDSDPPVTGI